MKVRIAEPLGKSSPGEMMSNKPPEAQGSDYRTGQWVSCVKVNYPGKPLRESETYDEWTFWDSNDIDLAHIFKLEDIDAVAVPQNSEHVQTVLRLETFVELQVLPEEAYRALGSDRG